MMIPGEATIISNYLMVSGWGWLDSYQALIVPYLTSAMGIFLFRQFYLTFPISLYESAKIDGCTSLRFIVQIKCVQFRLVSVCWIALILSQLR